MKILPTTIRGIEPSRWQKNGASGRRFFIQKLRVDQTGSSSLSVVTSSSSLIGLVT
jgi:hypothetical protein